MEICGKKFGTLAQIAYICHSTHESWAIKLRKTIINILDWHMNELTDVFSQLHFDDLRPFASSKILDDRDLFFIENLEHLDFTQRVIQPSFFTIAACTEGEARFLLNGEECHIQRGDLFIAFGRQIIDHFHRSSDFRAIALVQSERFVQESLLSLRYLWPYLIYLIHHPVIALTEDERTVVWHDYQLLKHRLNLTEKRLRKELSQAILQVFYLDICRMLEARSPRSEVYDTRTYSIFYHFMQLLSLNYMDEREVAWYADELNISPKYLTESVKSVSGRTAGQWITTMVIMEIKSLLRNTDLSIKEIAQHMSFNSQSFLGRYFKNVTGISPLDYRRQVPL